ncbi:hypothetical protein, conserved [Babesia ovata]|uniref:Extracellular matrix-binding ebh n=1 Tax=Babesia ovata TaxID=189622 RepID=A0A2H6KJH7_9APIC|nr:uncharacterized protein BOVATA_046230 [Babesia ovata]GBE63130.1 hypothetical protein, conserved [Babesia ovata]
MSFLHGVLQTVKDDENVTTYDISSDPKKLIKNLPASISKLMHKGSNDFQNAITQVSDALRAWSGELEERKKAFQDALSTLRDHDFDNFNKSLSELSRCSGSDVAAKLEACINIASYMLDVPMRIENCLYDLDPGLQKELKDHVNRVRSEVERVFAAASNDPLKAVVETTKEELEGLERKLILEVESRLAHLGRKLKTTFDATIQQPIIAVKQRLGTINEDLKKWSNEVRKVIIEAISRAQNVCLKLHENMAGGKKTEVGQGIEKIITAKDAIFRVDESLKRLIDSDLNNWIDNAEQIIRNALQNVSKILEQVEEDNAEKITQAISTMKQRTQNHFVNLKKEELKGIAFKASDYLNKLANAVETLLDNRFKQACEKYKLWISSSTTGGHAMIPTDLQESLQSLTSLSTAIQQAAQNINTRNGLRGSQPYNYLLTQSAEAQLQASLDALRRSQSLNPQLQNILQRRPNQPAHTAEQVAQNLEALTALASNIREAMNNAVSVLNEQNQAGERSAENIRADCDEAGIHALTHPLNEALLTASQFAGQLERQLSQHSRLRVPASIQAAVRKISEFQRSVIQFNANFTQGKTFLNEFDTGIMTPFNSLVGAVKTQANNPNGLHKGLQQYLKDRLQETYFKIHDPRTLEENSESIKKHRNALNTQNGLLSPQPNAISTAVQSIREQIKCLREKLNGNCIDQIKDLLEHGIYGDDEWKGRKENIGSLQTIYNKIYGIINEDLTAIVEAANHFLTQTIPTNSQEAMNKIIEEVTTQVNDKIADIQDEAKNQYHGKIHPMFESMKTKVSAHVRDINNSIDDDLKSGVKGLLRQLMDHANTGTKSRNNKLDKLKQYTNPKDHESVKNLSNDLREYLRPIMQHVEDEVKTPGTPGAKGPASEKQENNVSRKVNEIHGHVGKLLGHLKKNGKRKYNYDHDFVKLFQELKTSVSSLSPSKFDGHSNALLSDAISAGMNGFNNELDKAYVNAYAGKEIKEWEEADGDGRKASKILVTIMRILDEALSLLKHECERSWKQQKICLVSKPNIHNHLGQFLRKCGYEVTKKEESQNGELQCSAKMIGRKIVDRFAITTVSTSLSRPLLGIIKTLIDHINDYYDTCHLATSDAKQYPSSVFEMLRWLSGFRHNSVYKQLSFNGFQQVLEAYKEKDEEENKADDEEGPSVINLDDLSLPAYPHPIAVSNLSDALTDVCNHSRAVLVGILGHGHAGGIYACEFDTNSAGLSYPTNMDILLCMICDVINRLYRQLHFLLQQCRYDSSVSGWAECWYGNGVGGSAWKCNSMQCPGQDANQIAKQNTNQTHKQTCNQKCEQRVMCGVKSPLQSFLEDGLQGFLPHSLKSERGKLECSLKSHAGVPCITPMGFAGIAGLASHRRTGQFLMEVLGDFCGNQKSPLTKICSLFNCVLPSPPKSLSDMFGFYYSLLSEWNKNGKDKNRVQHRETAFTKAVSGADFDNPDTKLDITGMFKSRNHGIPKPADQTSTHLTGDLYALVNCTGNKSHTPSHPCGPYLRPLCSDICTMFSEKHANKYVSWIVFLTESFYDLLKKLLEDCEKTCGAEATRCKIGKCSKECATNKNPLQPSSHHGDKCKSIVECNYIRPTFYKYGFIHQSVSSLSGVAGEEGKRTCADFCAILKIVTEEKKTLHKIVFEKITGFLWAIREKFFWTLLALWSLSLLYLLHIAVVRLDVLRIRSHLRSPSSHRIAAQSLLAAARIKALANVKYFSP